EGIEIGGELGNSLKALSQSEGATLFMTLLAAFKILLHRYSGQDDIVVGTPVANRNRTEIEPLIGFFVNTLVLRSLIDGKATFREFLRRVRETALGAYAHQDIPFEKLVEEVQPHRNLSHTPLFQVMFVFQNAPLPAVEIEGLKLTLMEIDSGTTKFDLTLCVEEVKQGLRGWVEYDADLFDAEMIARITSSLRTLLEGIVRDPAARLCDLPLMGEAELEQVLVEWNETQADYPQRLCLHELFEAQAERAPGKTAIEFEDDLLSYGELNTRSNQLARYLITLGVKPETRVGICMDRSLDMVISMLAVLKAGGAYVPLDPAYPKRRLAYLLEDSQAAALLTQEAIRKSLLEAGLPLGESNLVCLDSNRRAIEEFSEASFSQATDPKNIAYVIYTSGSTGKPKGVAIEHHSAVALVSWAAQVFQEADLAAVLASTSICFDLSIFEIFVPLACGGKIVLIKNALELAAKPGRKEITLINTVPSAMAELLRMKALPQSLRIVNLAGEALPNKLAQQVYETETIDKVINLYGPSEDTTYSTYSTVTKGSSREPSIGRPVSNTQTYILDSNLRPVPVGVTGELHIAGEGLARGYLQKPDLTGDKFIPDPFSKAPGRRMYKTGDLARYRAGGAIDYLGRIDHQIKLRGFRIELGEIEAVLKEHPDVEEAAVIIREQDSDDKRIVAFVVTRHGSAPGIEEIRRYMKQSLPDHMVPGAFALLDELPKMPNGKLDRNALLAYQVTKHDSTAAPNRPRTMVAEVLAGIWADLLKVDEVSLDDNFFELGGHSLLATRLISRVQESLQVEMPLRTVFEAPALGEMSQRIEEAFGLGERTRIKPVTQAERGKPLRLSYAQERMWFLDQMEPDNPFYNVPAAVRLRGKLNKEALKRSLSEIERRHEALRTRIESEEGRPVQIVEEGKGVEVEEKDIRWMREEEREEEARRIGEEERRRGFDLREGKKMRAMLIRLADEEWIFMLTMHHIASDGWSLNLMIEEVSSLYDSYSRGAEPSLPELPIQYADYAQWQRDWLNDESLEDQLKYWTEQLAEAPAALELPTDRPRPTVRTYRGASETLELSENLSIDLTRLARAEEATLFMVLLAAFQVLLYRHSGQQDVLTGIPVAGRNSVELERLIGLFVNTLVIRTDLSGGPSFRQLLKRVKEAMLEAHAHKDLPFERLVEELHPERSLNRSPIFQVMFSFNDIAVERWELSNLSMSLFRTESQTAKFDLSLSMTNVEGRLTGSLSYSTDLFDAATIKRMAKHYETLLEAISRDAGESISDIPLLSDPEKRLLLFDWNATAADFPNDECLHHLFEQQVERTPEALAVICDQEKLTYRELNSRANQLAHHLIKFGAGPEVRVGICLKRSVDMVAGWLAILKSGGAYVPVDPSYPQERARFMLDDAQAAMLITDESIIESSASERAKMICLDSDWEMIARARHENPARSAKAGNIAYVIYTSGSTGQPKGVAVEHRSVLNLSTGLRRAIYGSHEAAQMRISMNGPLAFDTSVKQLIQLLDGHTLQVVPQEIRFDGDALVDYLRSNSVDVLDCTPSQLKVLVKAGLLDAPHAGPSLVLVGGEAIDDVTWKALAHSDEIQFYNVYGPTECTVDTTVCRVEKGSVKPNIGRPIANTQVYLLDSNLRPVPVGAAGELFIGGQGVARGYLNKPAMTAENFIPDPFSDQPGKRLYKTGDLARYVADGSIEFLRRKDNQIKLRGFRIELEEIESLLRQAPPVSDCVVVVRDPEQDSKRLVAYVVADEASSITVSELRSYLKQRLPEYILPSAIVMMKSLPLTTSGKVDRRALPDPAQTGIEPEEVIAPRTAVEEILASIWAEVLRVEQVGAGDNFFEIGGHSLLVTQVISRVRSIFSVEISIQELFEHPTLPGLAQRIERAQREGERIDLQPIQIARRDQPLRLSYAQERMWFLDQMEPDNPFYNVPAAVRLRGKLNKEALKRSL
ncbi:MAG TPA: amino acid adenylation domain-containing protein, partial [Blastocatellia bacterium]